MISYMEEREGGRRRKKKKESELFGKNWYPARNKANILESLKILYLSTDDRSESLFIPSCSSTCKLKNNYTIGSLKIV